MNEERLTKIETKLAYLEDFLNKLQEVTLAQGEQIRHIRGETRVIQSKVSEVLDSLTDIPAVKPPHY